MVKREVKLYNNINFKNKETIIGKIRIKLDGKTICEKNIYAHKKK